MIGGVQNNTPEIAQYVRCAPLPRITDSDPIYSAEASHIPLVVWKNAKHPEICKAFIEYLYDTDNYVEFIHSVPVGMLPSLKDIANQLRLPEQRHHQGILRLRGCDPDCR